MELASADNDNLYIQHKICKSANHKHQRILSSKYSTEISAPKIDVTSFTALASLRRNVHWKLCIALLIIFSNVKYLV